MQMIQILFRPVYVWRWVYNAAPWVPFVALVSHLCFTLNPSTNVAITLGFASLWGLFVLGVRENVSRAAMLG